MAISRICSIPGCGKRHNARGWCVAHWTRWVRHGDPLAGRIPNGEALRYFNEVVLPYEGDDCLPWPYAQNPGGYGHLNIDGRVQIVSRMVCEHVHGPAPTPEHEAAHSCGKGHLACVTKRHLSWKTPTGNCADQLIHGTRVRGEKTGTSKLTEVEVRQIIALKGIKQQKEIAAQFGVSFGTVSKIHRKTRWGWLEDVTPKTQYRPGKKPLFVLPGRAS